MADVLHDTDGLALVFDTNVNERTIFTNFRQL